MSRGVSGLLSLLLCVCAVGQPASETSQAVKAGFQDGQVVEFSGLPIKIELEGGDRFGVLRFGVATRDLTLSCYEEGSNTWVLRDLHSRLEGVLDWNSQRMLSGEAPVQVAVRGRYSAADSHLWLDEVFIPRIEQGSSAEEMTWDRFDPDRSDRSPPYAEGHPSMDYDQFYPPPNGPFADEIPLGTEYAVPPYQPPVEYPVRYYPEVEYEPPYSYRVHIPPSRGIRVGGSYIYSGPRYDYSWDDYYDSYYPWIHGRSPGDSGAGVEEPDGGGRAEAEEEEVPTTRTKSAISVEPRRRSRAERWGRSSRIDPGLLNPGDSR